MSVMPLVATFADSPGVLPACVVCRQQLRSELDSLKRSMLSQGHDLQQKVCSLQGQLADAELEHVGEKLALDGETAS